MAINRIIVESNLAERPFQAGETLFSYAKRILEEDNLSGVILDICTRMSIIDVSTHGRRDTTCGRQVVEIEVRTTGMVK